MSETEVTHEEVTLDSLAVRLDALGQQMNWLCENMQGLFLFVSQVGQNGGGLRGMMAALKQAPSLTRHDPNVSE
jgi:hypothetical protein